MLKITKGVVAKILPDHEMPINEYGVRADAIMDQKSVSSRMNSGKLYDGYLGAVSRYIKHNITNKLHETFGNNISNLQSVANKNKKVIEELWSYIVNFLSITDNEQYHIYKNNKNFNIKVEVLQEIVDKEFYIVIPIDNKKHVKDIVLDIENSIYNPPKTKITYINNARQVTTEDPILIETVYMLVLSKIADTWLSTSTARTNHFGVPISTSRTNKHRQPWQPNPVRVGETETRLYASYAGEEALAELRDRSASIETHKHLYSNILRAQKPTNIDRVVDRSVVHYDGDKPVKILQSIFNTGGIDIIYEDEHEEE